jgi:hypothetical protein
MDRFEMNVAVNGQHYCRIDLGEVTEAEAIKRARLLGDAIKASPALLGCWQLNLSLTAWCKLGRTVEVPPNAA